MGVLCLWIPGAGVGKDKYSRHTAETDLFLELQEAVPPCSNRLLRG